jgi:predicted DNA-binding ArsR family transcriptional regulator
MVFHARASMLFGDKEFHVVNEDMESSFSLKFKEFRCILTLAQDSKDNVKEAIDEGLWTDKPQECFQSHS